MAWHGLITQSRLSLITAQVVVKAPKQRACVAWAQVKQVSAEGLPSLLALVSTLDTVQDSYSESGGYTSSSDADAPPEPPREAPLLSADDFHNTRCGLHPICLLPVIECKGSVSSNDCLAESLLDLGSHGASSFITAADCQRGLDRTACQPVRPGSTVMLHQDAPL